MQICIPHTWRLGGLVFRWVYPSENKTSRTSCTWNVSLAIGHLFSFHICISFADWHLIHVNMNISVSFEYTRTGGCTRRLCQLSRKYIRASYWCLQRCTHQSAQSQSYFSCQSSAAKETKSFSNFWKSFGKRHWRWECLYFTWWSVYAFEITTGVINNIDHQISLAKCGCARVTFVIVLRHSLLS